MHILPCQRTVFFLTFFIISFDPQKYKDDRESKVIRSGNRQSGITYWVNIRSKLGANAYRPFAKD
ncbi:Uncharacterised protein [Bacteroides uniformis]|nr:Uncharacterised protein [Bacteroides uniformis]